MKKMFFIIALIRVAMVSNAQWWVGGSVGYMYECENDLTPNNITVAPIGGYSFNEHWGVGLGININDRFGKDVNVFGFGINPFARYTAYSYEGFSILFDGGINWNISQRSVHNVGTTSNDLFVGIKPGICYSFNDKFCVVAHVGFIGYQGYNLGNNGSYNRFGLKVDSETVNFGFYYCF